MDQTSLETFSDIEQRPIVSHLVKRLETALEFQERHDMCWNSSHLSPMARGSFLTWQKDVEGSGGSAVIAGKGCHNHRRMRPDWQEGILVHFDGSMGEMMAKGTYGSRGPETQLFNSLQIALDCVHPAPQDLLYVQLVLEQLEEIRPETATSSNDGGGAGPSLSE
ncbi:hypothetical protein L1987_49917 [Smallanthus sonchifolius]|uniref:Uncharacterized protein n=1 Tax=Smallanthus sonchifolius TaxID=185202 RepID=A0ACB9FWX2_9ASTR|nr:hypothetical protein L1987_49917 [Smallanthus sonchifolius]